VPAAPAPAAGALAAGEVEVAGLAAGGVEVGELAAGDLADPDVAAGGDDVPAAAAEEVAAGDGEGAEEEGHARTRSPTRSHTCTQCMYLSVSVIASYEN